jgi:hypothetical protein
MKGGEMVQTEKTEALHTINEQVAAGLTRNREAALQARERPGSQYCCAPFSCEFSHVAAFRRFLLRRMGSPSTSQSK